jgi:exonuclease III
LKECAFPVLPEIIFESAFGSQRKSLWGRRG